MNEKLPEPHRSLLGKPLRDLAHIGYLLDTEEREMLSHRGAWLEALAGGGIAPITAAQERFVQVQEGKEPPQTSFERTWMRVLSARHLALSASGQRHATPEKSRATLPFVCPACCMVGTNCTCGRSWF
jgi:uncharacterized protein YifE (UPF0438 family)